LRPASNSAVEFDARSGRIALTEVALWHWFAFGGLVFVLLMFDLVVFHRHAHTPSLRESTAFTVFWIGVALIFNAFIWWWQGHEAGVVFLTGYLVEKSMSMDNIFIFAVIFRFFQVPIQYQYRVLFWGILAAVFMRLAFILAGIALVEHFRPVLPIFGAFLLYTAYKLVRHAADEVHPDKNIFLRLGRRFFRVAHGDHHQHGEHFFVRQEGHWVVTPMFLVLLVVESTDVLFAVDSVPAIIGITHDRFIAFSSNVFAILGLRALYFLLAGVIDMFRYLHYGLSAVLAFVGVKMIAEFFAHEEPGQALITPLMSLAVIALILVVSIAASVLVARREAAAEEPPAASGHEKDLP
jgi:tellurite resistance protein TerC